MPGRKITKHVSSWPLAVSTAVRLEVKEKTKSRHNLSHKLIFAVLPRKKRVTTDNNGPLCVEVQVSVTLIPAP